MRPLLLAAAAMLAATSPYAHAGEAGDGTAMIRRCITAAAEVHRLPPMVLVILLRVEGGSLGAVSQNTNATVDIGPMQVNQIWLPQVAAHWHASTADAYRGLRDSFCANVEAGAWILRRGLDEAHGDFWEGVAYYHSHAPEHKATYLRQVLKQVLLLQARAAHPAEPLPPSKAAAVVASR